MHKTACLFLALVFVATSMTGCAAVQTMTPLQQLQTIEAGFAVAEATYDAICSVNAPPSFCTDPQDKANYTKAKAAIEAAVTSTKAVIDLANGADTAAVQAAIAAIVKDWVAYNNIVNTVQEKNAAVRHTRYQQIPL